MRRSLIRHSGCAAIAGGLLALAAPHPVAAGGDPVKGVRTFHNLCSPCHSVTPGRHMTGPSLSGIVGRKAGQTEGFERYSKALPAAAIEWNEQTLTTWLANPQAMVAGNSMSALVADETSRDDIVAYLLATQTPGAGPRDDIPKPYEKATDLKAAGPATRVAAISLCRDTYTVKMENGTTLLFWEPNLRFKTDGSANGPAPAKPVLVPTGMQGDRSYVIFASAQDMSGFIHAACANP